MKKLARLFYSVRVRSIIIFLICLLPIYAIGTGIFFWSKSTLERQYKEMQANRITFLADNLKTDIERLLELQYSFFSDNSLNRLTDTLSIMGNYDRDMCILDIENRLSTIQSSSRYVENLSVLIPSINQVISSSKISTLAPEQRDLLGQISTDVATLSFISNNTVYLYTSAYTGYNLSEPSMPKYALITALSNRELSSSLNALLQTQEEFICVGNDFSFIISSLDSVRARSYTNFISSYNLLDNPTSQILLLDDIFYYVRTTSIDPLGLTYISLVPEKILYKPMERFLQLFLLFSLSVVVVIFFFARYISHSIHKPLICLLDSFREVKKGNLKTSIQHDGNNEFSYIYDEFNSMTQQLEYLTSQVYKHQLLAQRAEFRQLQAQINPHFLFNSFFILRRRIRDGNIEQSMEMANALGEYFQFITRTASDRVPLSEEVRHARIYTQIQSARFGNRIKIDFQAMPPVYGSLMVERLILQPIIENAFEHGLEALAGRGLLRISFHESRGILSIRVEDNGTTLTAERLNALQKLLNTSSDELNDNEIEVTGLLNIHRRIRYRMGQKCGVFLGRSELNGLLTELRLTVALPTRKE